MCRGKEKGWETNDLVSTDTRDPSIVSVREDVDVSFPTTTQNRTVSVFRPSDDY